jgi:hypothetical protein
LLRVRIERSNVTKRSVKVKAIESYSVETSPREFKARTQFINGEITANEYYRIAKEEPMKFTKLEDEREFTVHYEDGASE